MGLRSVFPITFGVNLSFHLPVFVCLLSWFHPSSTFSIFADFCGIEGNGGSFCYVTSDRCGFYLKLG